MVLFLRDSQNNTIVDLEVYIKSEPFKHIKLSSVVDIYYFSQFLLQLPPNKQQECIQLFDKIQGLPSWLYEVYFSQKKDTGSEEDLKNIVKTLQGFLTGVAMWKIKNG